MRSLYLTFLVLSFFLGACGGGMSSEEGEDHQVGFLSVSIRDAETPVSIDQYLSLSFSSTIEKASIDDDALFILDENESKVSVHVIVLDSLVKVIPEDYLLPESAYTLHVTTALNDIDGLSLAEEFIYHLTTDHKTDEVSPTLLAFFPTDLDRVMPGVPISMEFSEDVSGPGRLVVHDGESELKGTRQMEGSLLRFIPDTALSPDIGYQVTLVGEVTDLSGNRYEGSREWGFTIAYSWGVGDDRSFTDLLEPPYDVGSPAHSMAIFLGDLEGSDYPYIVVGTDDGIELYRVRMTTSGYLTRTFVDSYVTASAVIALEVMPLDEGGIHKVLVGTAENGLYVIDVKDERMLLRYHDDTLDLGRVEGVHSARSAPPTEGTRYIYAASLEKGLVIFKADQATGDVVYVKSLPFRTGVVDVTAVSDTDPYQVYALTHFDGLKILDEEGNIVTEVDIPGALRKVTHGLPDPSYGEYLLYITSDSAKLIMMTSTGQIVDELQKFSRAVDMTINNSTDLVEGYDWAESYICDPDSGVFKDFLADGSGTFHFKTDGSPVAAIEFLIGGERVFATLEAEGRLRIYNAYEDSEFSEVTDDAIELSSDEKSVDITFSEFPDPESVTIDKFELISGVAGEVSEVTSSGKVVSVSFDRAVQSGDALVIGARLGLKDRVGNEYRNGTSTTHILK